MSPYFPQFFFREGGDIIAMEADHALGRAVEAEDAAANGGFTTAALSYEAEGFILLQFEGHAVDGFDIGDMAA
jgi:hypothetical protein